MASSPGEPATDRGNDSADGGARRHLCCGVPGERAQPMGHRAAALCPAPGSDLGGAALRCRRVDFALTVVTLAAIWAADQGRGPFLAPSPDNNVLVLQAFVLLTTLPILCMAVIAGARQQVTRLHHALLASLQDEVAILDDRGRVLEVNESWRRFTDDGNGQREFGRARTGEDYLAAYTPAAEAGDGNAQRTIAGVRDVLARALAASRWSMRRRSAAGTSGTLDGGGAGAA